MLPDLEPATRNKMMHDKCRKTITGKGSYDTIIKNLELFKRKYPSIFDQRVRFLSTVYSWNDVKQLAKVWDDEPVLKGHYPVHISHILPDFLDSARSYDSWEVKDSFYREAFIAYVNGDKGIMGGSFQKLVNIMNRTSRLVFKNSILALSMLMEIYMHVRSSVEQLRLEMSNVVLTNNWHFHY